MFVSNTPWTFHKKHWLILSRKYFSTQTEILHPVLLSILGHFPREVEASSTLSAETIKRQLTLNSSHVIWKADTKLHTLPNISYAAHSKWSRSWKWNTKTLNTSDDVYYQSYQRLQITKVPWTSHMQAVCWLKGPLYQRSLKVSRPWYHCSHTDNTRRHTKLTQSPTILCCLSFQYLYKKNHSG